jgi:type II secretory pathway pseudopilin PulG
VRRRLAQERGFGLVEVLVAGFILVVGIGGGVYTFVTSQKGSVTAERNATATAVASQALEEVRAMPYTAVGSDLTSVTDPLKDPDDPDDETKTILSSGVFTTRDGKSEAIVPGTLPALSDVTVTEGGRTATYKLYRFVSWRDDECQLVSRVNLKDLKDDVMNMKADLDTLANDTKTLDTLYGKLGSGPLKDQTGYLRTTIHHLHNDANAIVTAIGALPGQPDGMVNMSIDLCDIRRDIPPGTAMPDLSGVAAARTLLATLKTHMVDKLNTEAQGLISRLLSSVLCVLSCPSQDPYKDAMRQAYGTIMGTAPSSPVAPASTDVIDNEIERVLGALTVEIQKFKHLALLPDTKENTKRVTVGVVNPIDRDGTGPGKVVWMTTVLINPKDGLL